MQGSQRCSSEVGVVARPVTMSYIKGEGEMERRSIISSFELVLLLKIPKESSCFSNSGMIERTTD